MQRVSIDDPAWRTSFPHLVAPLSDEWIAGLLLRCDKENDWESGTTLTLFRRAINWRGAYGPYLTVPSTLKLDYLAQCLALPLKDLFATTYQSEVASCYDTPYPQFKQLSTFFMFCLCPVCLAQERRIQRAFVLPDITLCPEHRIILQEKCLCGEALQLFSQRMQPFTCHSCGLDWASLPRLPAEEERIAFEQKLLSYYEFFFSRGTPELLEHALWGVSRKLAEKEREVGNLISARFHSVPRSYLSRRANSETHYYIEGGINVHFYQGNVILGNLLPLLARLEPSPSQFIKDS
jgi:hypothetical protein